MSSFRTVVSVAAPLTLAFALTLYIWLTPGVQYAFDGAAVVAWIATAWEIMNAAPE